MFLKLKSQLIRQKKYMERLILKTLTDTILSLCALLSFQDHPDSTCLRSSYNHDNQVQQQRSGGQAFLLSSLGHADPPAPSHQRRTLCPSPTAALSRLVAQGPEQSLGAGPAGPVGTVGGSTLEMGPAGLLRLLPGPLAAVCLPLVLTGPPERRPGCARS